MGMKASWKQKNDDSISQGWNLRIIWLPFTNQPPTAPGTVLVFRIHHLTGFSQQQNHYMLFDYIYSDYPPFTETWGSRLLNL